MSNKIIKDGDKNKKKKSVEEMTSMKQYIVPTLVGLLVIGVIIAILIVATNPKEEKDNKDENKKTETVAGVGTYYADIVIEDYGTIVVKLDGDAAPITVSNFVKLANDGFYNGLTFHRIIEGFMMQGGAPKEYGKQASTIKGEFSANGYENNLKHTRGAISMARSNAYNSASSQFFIMHKEATHLDGNYAAFGYVIEGMDVVDKVCELAEPTDNNGSIASDKQPVIKSITIRK